MPDPRKKDELPDPQKVKDISIGRDPNSAVIFHALPRRSYTVDPNEVPDDRQKWQDQDHRIYVNDRDRKGIVGHLEKDWEESIASDQKNAAMKDEKNSTDDSKVLEKSENK
ncbi:14395_t:CDS:2 [Cetraspora pellucida]|uniref:14395_t:CDS:1 n=1 Tax=Cetraspora pellucida TaxID=1433469 RepID=A0A9N9P337_9GLOM|nr:14395_t:CDS:2 [Cetraspora pellucida]